MDDNELLRYSRQILLPEIDIEGQERLINASVLIIGAGGLGSPAAMYLAAAGVGHIVLVDDDKVDLSNLQRQIAHDSHDVGMDKALSAKETLEALNPHTSVTALCKRFDQDELDDQVDIIDIVLDCTDNFQTRFAVNRACVKTKTPLVFGAAIRFEGQISVFTPGENDSPCYHCLYADIDEITESCSQTGVIAPITGIIGSIQALEAIKLITGVGETLIGKLLLLDGFRMECNILRLPKNRECPTCGYL